MPSPMPRTSITMTDQKDKASSTASIGGKPSTVNLETVSSSAIGSSVELDEETNRKLLRKIDRKLMPVVSQVKLT